MTRSYDEPAADGVQPGEKGTRFAFFEEGKRLADEGITSADGLRSLAFFTMAGSDDIFGVSYNAVENDPEVEFYFIKDSINPFVSTERALFILTARVNSDGEFVDARSEFAEEPLEEWMQDKVDTVFMMNVARELGEDDGRVEASIFVEKFLKRDKKEQTSLEDRIGVFNFEYKRSMIGQRPSPKFKNLIQETILVTNPETNNITPRPRAD